MSYKVIIWGPEYKARIFFSKEPVSTLRLLSIVERKSADIENRVRGQQRGSGADIFFVDEGDKIGAEGYEAIGRDANCMVLLKLSSRRELCFAER